MKQHIAPLEEQCHNSKNAHFELCSQEVCLRPYLPSWIASHVYFLKWLWEGRSVILLMRLLRPGQWFFLSPEKLYFLSCDSVLLRVRYAHIKFWIYMTCVRLNMYETVMGVFICFKHFITLFMIIYDKPCFRVYDKVRSVPVWDFFK
jgi:hypothetical protein